jgi:hypothetical protein
MIDFTALTTVPNDLDVETSKSQEVLQHHFEACYKADLDSVMEDFTEQSIIVTEDGSFVGLNAIRNFYASLLQLFSKAFVSYKLKKVVVAKAIAYITWQLTTSEFEVPFGTDTFIIQNDRILYQTGGAYMIPSEINNQGGT